MSALGTHARPRRRRGGGGERERASPPRRGCAPTSGAGQVTLRWEPVDGAIGYLVHRAPAADGPFEAVDHGGRDVLAVPGPVYCDTTGEPRRGVLVRGRLDRGRRGRGAGELSEPVAGAARRSRARGRVDRARATPSAPAGRSTASGG